MHKSCTVKLQTSFRIGSVGVGGVTVGVAGTVAAGGVLVVEGTVVGVVVALALLLPTFGASSATA